MLIKILLYSGRSVITIICSKSKWLPSKSYIQFTNLCREKETSCSSWLTELSIKTGKEGKHKESVYLDKKKRIINQPLPLKQLSPNFSQPGWTTGSNSGPVSGPIKMTEPNWLWRPLIFGGALNSRVKGLQPHFEVCGLFSRRVYDSPTELRNVSVTKFEIKIVELICYLMYPDYRSISFSSWSSCYTKLATGASWLLHRCESLMITTV